MEITLYLTREEAQQVLNALIKEPYGEVYELVTKIQEQAASQMDDV